MMNEYINDDPLGRGPKPPQHHNLSPPPPRDTAFQVQALPVDVGPMFPDATFEGGRLENAPMQQHQHYNMPPRIQQQLREDGHNYSDYRQSPPPHRSPPHPRSQYNHTNHTSNESIPPSPMEIYMTTQDHQQYQTNTTTHQYHEGGNNNEKSSGYPRHVQADERRDVPPQSPLTDMGPYGGGDDRRSADPSSYYPPPSRHSNNERITPPYHNHQNIHQQCPRISESFPNERSKTTCSRQMSTRSEPNQYQSSQQQNNPRLIKSESETIHHRNNNYSTNGYNNNNSSRRGGGGRYDDGSRRRSHEPYNLDTLCCGEEYRYDNVHNQHNVRRNDDLYCREYERYKRTTSPRYNNRTNNIADPTGPLSPLSIPSCVIGPSPYDDDTTEAACASISSARENRPPRPQQGYYSPNNNNHHQYPSSYYTEEERDSNYHDGMNKPHVPSQVAVVYPTNDKECVPRTPPRDHYCNNNNTSPMRRDERRDDYSGSSTIYTPSSNYNTPSPPQHHRHMQQQNMSSRQYQHQLPPPSSNKYNDYSVQRNDQHYTQQQHRGVIESKLSVDIPPPPPPPYPPPHQTSNNRPNTGRPPPHNNTNQLSSSYKQQQQHISGTLSNLVCGTNLNSTTPIAIATGSSNSTNNNNNSQYATNERLKSQARHQILKEISAATNMRNSATSSKDVNFWNVQIKTLNDSFKKL